MAILLVLILSLTANLTTPHVASNATSSAISITTNSENVTSALLVSGASRLRPWKSYLNRLRAAAVYVRYLKRLRAAVPSKSSYRRLKSSSVLKPYRRLKSSSVLKPYRRLKSSSVLKHYRRLKYSDLKTTAKVKTIVDPREHLADGEIGRSASDFHDSTGEEEKKDDKEDEAHQEDEPAEDNAEAEAHQEDRLAEDNAQVEAHQEDEPAEANAQVEERNNWPFDPKVTTQILQYLPGHERCRAALVCRDWNRAFAPLNAEMNERQRVIRARMVQDHNAKADLLLQAMNDGETIYRALERLLGDPDFSRDEHKRLSEAANTLSILWGHEIFNWDKEILTTHRK